MRSLIIGRYSSAEAAARVHDEIVAAGVPASEVLVRGPAREDPTEPLPEDQGLAGFIGRMFSGATGDAAPIEKYLSAADAGGALVAVHVRREDEERIAQLMRRQGNVDVHPLDGNAAPPPPDVTREDANASEANDAQATVSGPQGNALPMAATAWQTSRGGSPSTIGQVGHDPGRPQADTEDIAGLGTDDDPRRSPQEARPVDMNGVSDALGHRVDDNAPGRGRAVGRANKT